MKQVGSEFIEFINTVKALRDPESGCPWDIAQTHESIRPYLLEESYEVLEAIDEKDDNELTKELGDLLLQVALHSQIANDRGSFSIKDVVKSINEKLIRRHPHVFGNVKAETPLEASQSWEKMKLAEKTGKKSDKKSIFSGVPASFPSLLRALRISEKASHVGFDWSELSQVSNKLTEELEEFQVELNKVDPNTSPQNSSINPNLKASLEHELGDVFFSLVQIARWLDLSPEDALRNCCNRFQKRFSMMEKKAGSKLTDKSIQELEELWELAKKETT